MQPTTTSSSALILDYASKDRNSTRAVLALLVKSVCLMVLTAALAVMGYAVADVAGPKTYTSRAYLQPTLISLPARLDQDEEIGCRIGLETREIVRELQNWLLRNPSANPLTTVEQVQIQTVPETSLICVKSISNSEAGSRSISKKSIESVLSSKSPFGVYGLKLVSGASKPIGVTSLTWRICGAGAGAALFLALLFFWKSSHHTNP